MNPVIGLDVSKGESHAPAFTDRGVPYGKVFRFEHNLEGLVTFAFAGVDPSVFSSGKFTATRNKITKRGSRRLRTTLYLAVRCGLRSSRNQKFRAYYDKKRA
ncbi:hypothetical protein J14TS5_34000 [Paenibacillus lautus]|nr:hypothetical protein J14TS5_34000 [Paenibacillus lautus]